MEIVQIADELQRAATVELIIAALETIIFIFILIIHRRQTMSWWSNKEDLEEVMREPKKKTEQKQEEKIKDRECINCLDFFDCPGKPRGVSCNMIKERK